MRTGHKIEIELVLGQSIKSLDEVHLVSIELDANFLIPKVLGSGWFPRFDRRDDALGDGVRWRET